MALNLNCNPNQVLPEPQTICPSCGRSDEALITYGDYSVCRECYAKLKDFLHTSFHNQIIEILGLKKSYEILCDLFDLLCEYNHTLERMVISLEEWQEVEMSTLLQTFLDYNLIAYKQIPAGKYFATYIFISLDMSFKQGKVWSR
jgi:uncharacterized protein YdiU (UPF0061 family)